MFKKVLVANRGEIALRVIRACKEMGLESVAVHSTADADALHVKFADQAVCIGPPPSRGSYLNVPPIISAAEVTGADAIHPGYGFLSENAEFAEVCIKCGLNWIGPPPAAMRLMGDKISARAAMNAAGVPTLPGSTGLTNEDQVHEAAERIGLPVIFKASAGGGGRGMQIVHEREKLIDAWNKGRTEAAAAFGNPEMYMERYCQRPRHIEIQVVGDKHGHYAHLGERECSIQRRHKKLSRRRRPRRCRTRRAPSSWPRRVARSASRLHQRRHARVPARQRRPLLLHGDEHAAPGRASGDRAGHRARSRARADPDRRGRAAQLPEERRARGHAIECRINAEDPVTFAPWPGRSPRSTCPAASVCV